MILGEGYHSALLSCGEAELLGSVEGIQTLPRQELSNSRPVQVDVFGLQVLRRFAQRSSALILAKVKNHLFHGSGDFGLRAGSGLVQDHHGLVHMFGIGFFELFDPGTRRLSTHTDLT